MSESQASEATGELRDLWSGCITGCSLWFCHSYEADRSLILGYLCQFFNANLDLFKNIEHKIHHNKIKIIAENCFMSKQGKEVFYLMWMSGIISTTDGRP